MKHITTITIELTHEERIDLLQFRDRMLAESRQRVYATVPAPTAGGLIRSGIAPTDTSRDAERIVTILERILFHQYSEPNVTTTGGIVQPSPVLRGGPFKVGDAVLWTVWTSTGTVKAVVPPGELPGGFLPNGFLLSTGDNARNIESYLVQVGDNKLLYWPPVNNLRSITP